MASVAGLVFLMVSQTIVNAELLGCPHDWWQFGQSCYKFIPDPLNWSEARKACLEIGSDLIVSNSEEENNFINDLMQKNIVPSADFRNAWLGCTHRDGDSGQWKCNGQQIEFSKFRKDVNITGNGCFTLGFTFKKWNLVPCDETKSVFCERKSCMNPLRCSAISIDHAQPKCLLGHTFKETIIQHPLQCCFACARDPNCSSFNLSGKACQLNNATISQIEGEKTYKDNCVYYEYE